MYMPIASDAVWRTLGRRRSTCGGQASAVKAPRTATQLDISPSTVMSESSAWQAPQKASKFVTDLNPQGIKPCVCLRIG